MNRNGGYRIRTHILNTFLHWLCCLGFSDDEVKESADAALGETADVEKVLGVDLKDD